MNTHVIRAAIEHIRSVAGDDERAHSAEDDLRQEFIEYIALRVV
jgi:hypothetical protein